VPKTAFSCAMGQVVSQQPLTAEAWVWSQPSQSGISAVQWHWGRFSLHSLVFSCHYYSTKAPYSCFM